VRRLLQKKALSVEDTVDILSLKDNTSTVVDYPTALHLLARAEVGLVFAERSHERRSSAQKLPEARRQAAFRTVWRRIYIHDEYVSSPHPRFALSPTAQPACQLGQHQTDVRHH